MSPIATLIEEAKKFNIKGSYVIILLVLEYFIIQEWNKLNALDEADAYNRRRTERLIDHQTQKFNLELQIALLTLQLEECQEQSSAHTEK